MNGTNYVPVPYSPVQAYSASNDIVIPSGKVSTGGTYYYWDDDGFISKGWYTDVVGPTYEVSEDSIRDHIDNFKNMDSYFTQWREKLSSLEPAESTTEIMNFFNCVFNANNACAVMEV